MASIGSISARTSGLIGGANRITGLASGLDVDSLVESMTMGTLNKIQKQQQAKQKLEWKMNDYRSISSKLISFQNKYNSYSSSTNLRSPSFYDKSIVTALGENSKYISVSGKSSAAETMAIKAVKQLAKDTSYVSKNSVSDQTLTGSAISGDETFTKSLLEGNTLQLTYGNSTYNVRLEMGKEYGTAQEVVDGLNDALKKINYGKDGGNLGDKIKISLNSNDKVEINYASKEIANKGDTLKVSGGSENLLKALGVSKDMEATKTGAIVGKTSMTDSLLQGPFQQKLKARDMITGADKSLSFNYNGTIVKIDVPSADEKVKINGVETNVFEEDGSVNMEAMAQYLENKLADEFGSGRIDVSYKDGALAFDTLKPSGDKDTSSVLRFTAGDANAAKALGLTYGDSNRLNTSAALKDSGLKLKNDGTNDTVLSNGKDADGNKVGQNDYVINIKNNATGEIVSISKTVDGKDFDENTSLSDIMKAINESGANVKVSYLETSDKLSIVSTEKGASGDFSIVGGALDKDGNDVSSSSFNLGQAIFGDSVGTGESDDYSYTKGQDAIILVDYDGDGGADPIEITRSSNSFNLDGLNVTVNNTFGMTADGKVDETSEAITFSAKVDSDKITEAVKNMINEFNEIIELSNSKLSEKPNRKYTPLTDEQKEDMSDSEIEKYEELAKAGMLFNDVNLRGFTTDIRFIFGSSSEQIKMLEDMGITTSSSYTDNGKLVFDEEKFKSYLEANNDKVAEIFTEPAKTVTDSNGNTSKIGGGVMTQIYTVFEKYAATTGSTKGIFVEIAGAKESPLSILNNSLQKQMNEIDNRIDELLDKYEDEVERAYNKYASLETYISQMNSQSSYLSSMNGQ